MFKMKKIIHLLFLLIIIISIMKLQDLNVSGLSEEKRTFKHIILVTFDGARKYWIDTLVENGTLNNLAQLKNEGSEITLRIVDHTPSTDPGISCIESGYGPDITGINQNYFYSNKKPSVPMDLTITERIKTVYGNVWKTALIMPWTQGGVNVTTSVDSTLWNQKQKTDYWFSSENVTWSRSDPNILKNALDFDSALLRANYTAYKATEFINNSKDSKFYLRIHFTEPDTAGHGYTESIGDAISPMYKQALIECDKALGSIINFIKNEGIYNETVILVTTDHGFRITGHGGLPYPFGDPDVTQTWLISNDPEVTNELGWGLENDISPTCLGLAGIDSSIFQPLYNKTSNALPIWKANTINREVTPPSLSNLSYSKAVHEGEKFKLTVRLQDQSGIKAAQIRYLLGISTIWRTNELSRENETFYSVSLGPFEGGTVIKWYLFVIDNSTSLNIMYYPLNVSFLSFSVDIETIPPMITNIQFPGQILEGETLTITLQAQDESGISSIAIYYTSNSTWNKKKFTINASGTYKVTIGPFYSNNNVRWYINATDNSVNNNVASYPSNKQTITLMVKVAGGVLIEFLIVGVAFVVIAFFVVILKFRRGLLTKYFFSWIRDIYEIF
ncbi:MAG: hypothetical protein QG670_2144 [Thermoproteota archaeon]|nr:hypothetical protein [Thermoproteota archaeon]